MSVNYLLRTCAGQKLSYYHGAKLWNVLNKETKLAPSMLPLKIYLRGAFSLPFYLFIFASASHISHIEKSYMDKVLFVDLNFMTGKLVK